MCRLQHALQMRWIALGERELLCELVERDPPGDRSHLTRNFDQAIKSSGDWIGERLIERRTKRDGVAGGDVLAKKRRDRDARIARLRCREHRERA